MADTYAVTAKSTAVEFDTVQAQYNACLQIDEDHHINLWSGSGDDGYAQVFSTNLTTYAVTAEGTALEFDTTVASYKSATLIDDNHVLVCWNGSAGAGKCQILEINLSTWAVTAKDSPITIDSGITFVSSCCTLDSTHALVAWRGSGDDGYVQVVSINDSTWAVTAEGTKVEFDSNQCLTSSMATVDSTHAIIFYEGGNEDGFTRIFEVNDSTWAVTAKTALEFDTVNCQRPSCAMIDSTHAINFWVGNGADGFVQVFEVNDSTWAVTAKSTALEFDTTNCLWTSCAKIDSTYAINFWAGTDNDGYAQVFSIDSGTYAVTAESTALEYDTTFGSMNSCAKIDFNHYINFWAGDGFDGYVQAFEVDISEPVASTFIPKIIMF